MFLIIDNYDSFVHNLARYVELSGAKCRVVRNDKITIKEIEKLSPSAILLSPGPCTPADAGICIEAIKHFGSTTPILGVCLGHQAIGEAYGGKTVQAAPMHGKSCAITHNKKALFNKLPSPLMVGRYHSLVTKLPKTAPLKVTAKTEDGIIMAMQHKAHPVYGVQFHPESILTEHGHEIMKNFKKIVSEHHKQKEAA